MNKLLDLVNELNGKSFVSLKETPFYYITDGYEDYIGVDYLRDDLILHSDSDFGWDFEKEDVERDNKEQIIWGLKEKVKNLQKLIKAIEEK